MVEHSDTTPARREDTSPAGEHTTADQPESASGGSQDSQPGRARHEQRGRRGAAAYRAAIVGCRFAGLFAAKALRGQRVEVTIIDRTNHHPFQPLLYQMRRSSTSPNTTIALRWWRSG